MVNRHYFYAILSFFFFSNSIPWKIFTRVFLNILFSVIIVAYCSFTESFVLVCLFFFLSPDFLNILEQSPVAIKKRYCQFTSLVKRKKLFLCRMLFLWKKKLSNWQSQRTCKSVSLIANRRASNAEMNTLLEKTWKLISFLANRKE